MKKMLCITLLVMSSYLFASSDPVIKAAKRCQIDKLESYQSRGIDLNDPRYSNDGFSNMVAFKLIKRCSERHIKRAVEIGILFDVKNNSRPLIVTAAKFPRSQEAVVYLIENNLVDIDTTSIWGQDVAKIARKYGNYLIYNAIIKKRENN
ncbi:MAG: hypothetical protein N4A33_06925 [Bacteriovoracaceae bacterium]|jgi:hypothetical protein|nr:hypothetical protein [Bacteriovoracaceae bacterium]